jgi:hypothetical protein
MPASSTCCGVVSPLLRTTTVMESSSWPEDKPVKLTVVIFGLELRQALGSTSHVYDVAARSS